MKMDVVIKENVDPKDLRNFEGLYNEQLRRGYVSEKTQFDYAWCLVRSRYVNDMHKGIELLKDLLRSAKDELSKRDYLYYIAVGYVRIKDYEKALEFTQAIEKIEPQNKQARELQHFIKQKMKTDGLLGMAIVGGAVLAIGGLAGITIAALKK